MSELTDRILISNVRESRVAGFRRRLPNATKRISGETPENASDDSNGSRIHRPPVCRLEDFSKNKVGCGI